jgi:hypothetical protein
VPDSFPAFQNKFVGNTDIGAGWKRYRARLKMKRFLESKIIQSGIAASKSLMAEYPAKRWIAKVGTLMRVIGDWVSALFPGNRKSRD